MTHNGKKHLSYGMKDIQLTHPRWPVFKACDTVRRVTAP